MVTTAHLRCMRTGKCHLNLAYLGSGVCVKNAHHMFCVTSCSVFSFFFTNHHPPPDMQSCGISSCLCLKFLNIAKWGEGWGEGTAPTLLGRIWDIRKYYMTSRASWMSVFYADPGIRFCCFGDYVLYAYYFSQRRDLCNYLHVTLFDVAPYIATDSLGIAKNMLNLAYCRIHFILHCTPHAQGHRV